MVENTLDEETEYGRVDGRHELVTAQNIVENGLMMRINVGESISPTRSRYATTEAAIAKKIQGRYFKFNKVLFICA